MLSLSRAHRKKLAILLFQLAVTLPLRRQRNTNALLALLLDLILLHPMPHLECSNIHCLAYVRDADPLFFDQTHDLEPQAGLKPVALSGHLDLW